MKIKTKTYNGAIFVKLIQNKLNYQDADNFKANLLDLAKKGYRTIFIDLENLEMIDSSGIGLFISFWKTYGSDVNLKFYALQPHIKKVFTSACLNRVFEFYETEQEVLASLNN